MKKAKEWSLEEILKLSILLRETSLSIDSICDEMLPRCRVSVFKKANQILLSYVRNKITIEKIKEKLK